MGIISCLLPSSRPHFHHLLAPYLRHYALTPTSTTTASGVNVLSGLLNATTNEQSDGKWLKGSRARKCRYKFPRKPNAIASGLLNDLLGIILSDLTTPRKSVNANGGAPCSRKLTQWHENGQRNDCFDIVYQAA
ncbi:hypothetical protein EV715DRAFT_263092 [Schizophyllum commune]